MKIEREKSQRKKGNKIDFYYRIIYNYVDDYTYLL